jgi:hypothetical protein
VHIARVDHVDAARRRKVLAARVPERLPPAVDQAQPIVVMAMAGISVLNVMRREPAPIQVRVTPGLGPFGAEHAILYREFWLGVLHNLAVPV